VSIFRVKKEAQLNLKPVSADGLVFYLKNGGDIFLRNVEPSLYSSL
jgi:hypothetical protein